MNLDPPVSPALKVALAWQPRETRGALQGLLALDAKMAATLAQAREPLLAQMRLAWWRDRLREPAGRRPVGEPLLEAIGTSWSGEEEGLVALVDGWEALLADAPLGREDISIFVDGRAKATSAFARLCGVSGIGAAIAGQRWALAEYATGSGDLSGPDVVSEIARTLPTTPYLPRSLRGLAVLDALAARSLARGEPMLAGRRAALVAWRVGMTGR